MCIIIAKNKGNRLPSYNELKYSFEYNPDGAGFMYTDNGKVIIDKGYMTFETFMARYKTLCKKYNDFKDKSLVIHCRIGTAGSNTAKNTHPYPLTKSIKELHKTYTKTNLGIAHNGIIRDFDPDKEDGDVNDTQNFIRIYMTRKFKEDNKFYKRKFEQDYIEKITTSRFAILNDKDELFLIGSYVTDNGLKFSNAHYKSYSYKDFYYDKYDSDYDYDYANSKTPTWSYTWNPSTKKYESKKVK